MTSTHKLNYNQSTLTGSWYWIMPTRNTTSATNNDATRFLWMVLRSPCRFLTHVQRSLQCTSSIKHCQKTSEAIWVTMHYTIFQYSILSDQCKVTLCGFV